MKPDKKPLSKTQRRRRNKPAHQATTIRRRGARRGPSNSPRDRAKRVRQARRLTERLERTAQRKPRRIKR